MKTKCPDCPHDLLQEHDRRIGCRHLLCPCNRTPATHRLVRVDRRAWWCSCGADCLNTEGSFQQHRDERAI